VFAPHSQYRAAVTLAQRGCGGQLKIIASIEEPQLIAKILSHLERAAPEQNQSELPLRARGPPVQSSLL
jgi:hypothetical protein